MALSHQYGKQPRPGFEPTDRKYYTAGAFGKEYLMVSDGWRVNGRIRFTAYDVIGEVSRWGETLGRGEKFAMKEAEKCIRNLDAFMAVVAKAMGDPPPLQPKGRLIYNPIGGGLAADAFKGQIIEADLQNHYRGCIRDAYRMNKLRPGVQIYPYFADYKPEPEKIYKN